MAFKQFKELMQEKIKLTHLLVTIVVALAFSSILQVISVALNLTIVISALVIVCTFLIISAVLLSESRIRDSIKDSGLSIYLSTDKKFWQECTRQVEKAKELWVTARRSAPKHYTDAYRKRVNSVTKLRRLAYIPNDLDADQIGDPKRIENGSTRKYIEWLLNDLEKLNTDNYELKITDMIIPFGILIMDGSELVLSFSTGASSVGGKVIEGISGISISNEPAVKEFLAHFEIHVWKKGYPVGTVDDFKRIVNLFKRSRTKMSI